MKRVIQPKGVTDLLSENTKLKRSILDFSNQIKRQTMRKTQLSHGDSVIGGTTKEMETQIRDLFFKVAALETLILKKDLEIKALLEYKEKWENLKREAASRKKQRESSTESMTTM
jgi:hypothetical protein